MPYYDEAYIETEKKIKEALYWGRKELDLSNMGLTELPESIGLLWKLEYLDIRDNNLTTLPETLGNLFYLKEIRLYGNNLTSLPQSFGNLFSLEELWLGIDSKGNPIKELPESIDKLAQLHTLALSNCKLVSLNESIGKINNLKTIYANNNLLTDLPSSFSQLKNLETLDISGNPLVPELIAAYKQGFYAVKTYLRTKAEAQITLYEAKLILIGEGEVGKSCLLGALRSDPWEEGLPTTHGIEIKTVKISIPDSKTEITLNAWDFGGQRVYRPTHQLFFSAPAIYLVVWKPREGYLQGFVREWIQLVKHRESEAKILVVATHGGPQLCQPDIDRQELLDCFGKDTLVDFFFVDSKPDKQGYRKGIEQLKQAVARVAVTLPEVGRSVPKSFADVRSALAATNKPYLPLDEVLAICHTHNMDNEIARVFITISHRLGQITHYENDPALRDIVILRPDWLATAMSYVLNDDVTRKNHGLVRMSRLNQLWDDPTRPGENRYLTSLHSVFLRLMERFDLSYRVAESAPRNDNDPQSLIAQLVPDTPPENFSLSWFEFPSTGDLQQTQICRIVDEKGNSAPAEGLFYQLIVRLHKYSLGRADYKNSVHWQRGLVLDDGYNGRALLEHKGNDVQITVRAPYPERFLAMLTEEVKCLVESFWEGLHCNVMVPCLNPKSCIGLFEVSKLMENLKHGHPEQPCPICNEWQSIEQLLHNAPAAAQPISLGTLLKDFALVKETLNEVNDNTRRILSQVDKNYADFIEIFADEAKEGPRLYSLFPLDRSKNNFSPKNWIREKFRLVLWCEHSRLPLPVLNNGNMKKGVYDLDIDREWFKKAAPYLKLLSGTLSMVLPIASSAIKIAVNEVAYKAMEEELNFGKSVIDATLGETTVINDFMGIADSATLEHGVAVRGDGATLRELHTLLKKKDPGFGGLVRVLNKRNEFLWVHEKFAGEY